MRVIDNGDHPLLEGRITIEDEETMNPMGDVGMTIGAGAGVTMRRGRRTGVTVIIVGAGAATETARAGGIEKVTGDTDDGNQNVRIPQQSSF